MDKKTHKRSNSELDTRDKIEQDLQTNTRHLVCPSHLPVEAKAEWLRIVAFDNERAKPVIYDSDISMLRAACVLWAAYVECETAFIQNPKMLLKIPVKVGKDGKAVDEEYKLITNPAYAEMRKLAKDMKPLYTVFALTPQGRAQYGVDKAKGKSKQLDDSDEDDSKYYS